MKCWRDRIFCVIKRCEINVNNSLQKILYCRKKEYTDQHGFYKAFKDDSNRTSRPKFKYIGKIFPPDTIF